MSQLPPETQKKEQVWFLPFSVFSLAREKHIQILNDTGIISEQTDPMVNSILRMPPTRAGAPGWTKGWAPCSLRSGREDKETNTV